MRPSLFISLGTSPAVVPEAFLLPGVDFAVVRVLTSASTKVELVQHFFATQAPRIHLQIDRVDGFDDLRGEGDHFHFEEVLYRWILEAGIAPENRYVCLSGGFKTMSAAMQKAAAVLGAQEVFHVLADSCCLTPDNRPRPPASTEEVLAAREAGHLHFIRLGPESGWPQWRTATAANYPLTVTRTERGVRWLRADDDAFRQRLHEIVERSHRIAGAWDQLAQLPFPALATWPGETLRWLDEPLDPAADRGWVAALPKVELHCHLGGFATHGPELAAIRAAAAAPDQLPPLADRTPPPGWPLPAEPCGLVTYLRLGDNNGSRLLRDPGCLAAQCRRLYAALVSDGVLYAEIRCSPNNYTSSGRPAWDVLADIRGHFQACMDASAASATDGEPACHVNLIVIATRKDGGDRSDISRHLALAITAAGYWQDERACRVVGVDLAGFEHRETRAALFAADFEAVHRVGLAVTVHAGENDDAEGIWQAVFRLNARRLGHALHLGEAPDLQRAVAERRIAVEMCPAANLQIKGYPLDAEAADARRRYPLLDYLRAGVPVTVNTDNLGISSATLGENLLLAARLCPGITRLEVLRLQRHALDAAFVPPTQRGKLARRLADRLPAPG